MGAKTALPNGLIDTCGQFNTYIEFTYQKMAISAMVRYSEFSDSSTIIYKREMLPQFLFPVYSSAPPVNKNLPTSLVYNM